MDPFRLCFALGPMAIYLLLLGAINLGRRPLVVSGGRDATALGLAMAGFVIVGPIELFFPHDATAQFGLWVWVMVLALYGLGLVLLLLVMRPRLVVYNVTLDQLRPALAEWVAQLEADNRWAGDTLSIPSLGVQLHIESFSAMRNVSLVSVGGVQNHMGWHRLEGALRARMARMEVSRNPRGLSLVVAGATTMALLAMIISRHPDTMTERLSEVFDAVQQMLQLR